CNRLAGAAAGDLRLLFLETGTDQSVHLARQSRHGQPNPPLVPVSSRRVASGPVSALGSVHVGRSAHGGPAHHRRGVSAQLAVVPAPLRNGWIRQSFLHWYFVLIHFQAALFCYWLCRDLKRSRAASLVSGLVFGLGGFVGTNGWPQMLNGAVWAP